MCDYTTMSNEEIGNLIVDMNKEELEAFELALARIKGEPEPVLYDDTCIGPTEDDEEERINKLIALQERMCKGMVMIQECNKVLQEASDGKYLKYDVYKSWVDRRSKLWTHWHTLKGECATLIGNDTYLWVKYFNLAEEDITPYHTVGDTTEVDEQVALYLTQDETVEELLVADLLVRE